MITLLHMSKTIPIQKITEPENVSWRMTETNCVMRRAVPAMIFVWDDQTKALVPWAGKAKEPSAHN